LDEDIDHPTAVEGLDLAAIVEGDDQRYRFGSIVVRRYRDGVVQRFT
jgi:hypothetical protein